MSSLASSFPSFSSRSSTRRSSAGLVRRWVHKILLEIEVRRAMRRLGTFDDQMLHDIGLDRGGLEHPLRHGNSGSGG